MGTHSKVAQVSKRMLAIYFFFFYCALLSSTPSRPKPTTKKNSIHLLCQPLPSDSQLPEIDSRHPKITDVIALKVLQDMLTNRPTVSKCSRLGIPHKTKCQGIPTPGPCPCTSFSLIRHRMPQGIGSFLEPTPMTLFFFFSWSVHWISWHSFKPLTRNFGMKMKKKNNNNNNMMKVLKAQDTKRLQRSERRK